MPALAIILVIVGLVLLFFGLFVEADPATTTVEATAARWGFADAASFVAAYRAVYRTEPETTLRR